jgi:hypothetical protein
VAGVGGEVFGIGGGGGEFVGAFVFIVASVAFDPLPVDLVTGYGGIEALPEVGVFEGVGGFGGAAPAEAAPFIDPAFGHGVDEVFGVGVNGDVTGGAQGFEAGDGGEEFHAVVGGEGEAAGEFAAVLVVKEDGAEAAGAGVATGGAVGVEGDLFHAWLGRGVTPERFFAGEMQVKMDLKICGKL